MWQLGQCAVKMEKVREGPGAHLSLGRNMCLKAVKCVWCIRQAGSESQKQTHDLVNKILSVNSLLVKESVHPCPNSPVMFSMFLTACIFKTTDYKCSFLCLVFSTDLHEFVSEEYMWKST